MCEVSCWSTLVCIHFHIHTFTQIHIQWAHRAFNSVFHMGGFLKISAFPCLRTAVFMASADRPTWFLPRDGKENDQKYKGIVSHVFSSSVSSTEDTPKPSWPEQRMPWMAFRNGKVSRGDRVSCAGLLLLPDETQLSFQWKAGVIFIPHQALKTIHIYHFFYLLSTVTVKKKWGYQAEASGRVLF